MKTADAGDALIRWLTADRLGRTECVVVGLTLAFNWPEWSRALMEAANGGDPDDQEVVTQRLREFVETHPIEQEAPR